MKTSEILKQAKIKFKQGYSGSYICNNIKKLIQVISLIKKKIY